MATFKLVSTKTIAFDGKGKSISGRCKISYKVLVNKTKYLESSKPTKISTKANSRMTVWKVLAV